MFFSPNTIFSSPLPISSIRSWRGRVLTRGAALPAVAELCDSTPLDYLPKFAHPDAGKVCCIPLYRCPTNAVAARRHRTTMPMYSREVGDEHRELSLHLCGR